MNNYYIDPSFTGASDGTINAPFKSFGAMFAAGITHPCTIGLKRGTVLVENVLAGSALKNTTNQYSYITDYGDKKLPKPVWINSTVWGSQESGYTYTGQHLTSRNTRNLIISNINFSMRSYDIYKPITGALPIETIWLRLEILNGSGEPTIDANVWVQNCKFSAAVIEGTARRSNYEAVIHIIVTSSGAYRADKFGVKGCDFVGVSRAITCTGNHSYAADTTDNSQGTLYSRGVQVENCSFVRNGRGAVLFQGVESALSAETPDVLQSYMANCNYSRYRWDSMNDNDTAQSADAAFWTWRCNRILIERIYGGGSYSLNLDCELLDFDYMTWDSVARHCVSFHNSAILLSMGASSLTSQGAARAPYNSGLYTVDQYFYARRNGQGNNVIKECVSYNDGVDLGNAAFVPYAGFIKTGGGAGTYNLTVQNCLCIDTVSRFSKPLITTLPLMSAPGLEKVKLINNVFIFPYLAKASLLPTISASQEVAGTRIESNRFYCVPLDLTSINENLSQGSNVINTTFGYPNSLVNIPRQVPPSLEESLGLLKTLGLMS